MTKIDIISGFLGAGKTTFIKKMIDEAFQNEKIVLIENEFGEVGIDGGFLKDAGIEITEMNSGCICCSLVGDFGENLKAVLNKFKPDRILIEPSGVGKLSDVMKSVLELETDQDIKLNALVAVVNAKKATKQMKSFGEFFNNQVEHATTIILSRTQEMAEDKLEQCVKQIQHLNPAASIITTEWGKISGTQLLKAMEEEENLEQKMLKEQHHHEHHDHHHDHEHDENCTCGCQEHEHHDHDHHHDHEHDENCTCGCQEHDHHHDHEHDENCTCGCQEHEHHDHDHHHDHEHDENCTCGCHDHHHHHADDVFVSWGKETPHKYTKEKIEEILQIFCNTENYGNILRAKGMVEGIDGEWIYFDLVEGDYELRDGEPDYTGRLCVIGVNIDKQKLEELFELA